MDLLLRRVIRGGGWVIAGRVTALLAILAIQFILARLLSPMEFGAYSVLASLVAVAALAAQVGLNYTVVRMSAEAMARGNPGVAYTVIAASLKVVLLVSIACAGSLLWPLGPWLVESMTHMSPSTALLLATGSWLAFVAIQGVVAEAFRGLQKMAAASLSAGLLGPAFLALLLGTAAIAGWPVDLQSAVGATLSAHGLALILTGGALLVLIAAKGERRPPPYRLLLSASWPAGICAVALLATRHIDLWVVGARNGPTDAALYGAAARLGDLASFPLMMVNASIAPVIAELYAKGERGRLERLLRTAALVATVVSLVLSLPMMLVSRQAMGLAFGDFYIGGATVLVLFLLANVVNAATGSCGLTLLMTGHQRVVMWLVATAAVAIGAGGWLVAPAGGPTAVATVACGVIAVQNVVTMLAVRRKLGIVTAAGWRDARTIAHVRSRR